MNGSHRTAKLAQTKVNTSQVIVLKGFFPISIRGTHLEEEKA
jgi:hypothetical protein